MKEYSLTCEHCAFDWQGQNLRLGLWLWFQHLTEPRNIIRADMPILWHKTRKGKWRVMGKGDAYS